MNKLRKWLHSPINEDDWFGVHIRQTYQDIFDCKHEFIEAKFRRKCSICGKRQYMVYHQYGNQRTSWRDIPLTSEYLFKDEKK